MGDLSHKNTKEIIKIMEVVLKEKNFGGISVHSQTDDKFNGAQFIPIEKGVIEISKNIYGTNMSVSTLEIFGCKTTPAQYINPSLKSYDNDGTLIKEYDIKQKSDLTDALDEIIIVRPASPIITQSTSHPEIITMLLQKILDALDRATDK
jgi:hypothetical protein